MFLLASIAAGAKALYFSGSFITFPCCSCTTHQAKSLVQQAVACYLTRTSFMFHWPFHRKCILFRFIVSTFTISHKTTPLVTCLLSVLNASANNKYLVFHDLKLYIIILPVQLYISSIYFSYCVCFATLRFMAVHWAAAWHVCRYY